MKNKLYTYELYRQIGHVHFFEQKILAKNRFIANELFSDYVRRKGESIRPYTFSKTNAIGQYEIFNN